MWFKTIGGSVLNLVNVWTTNKMNINNNENNEKMNEGKKEPERKTLKDEHSGAYGSQAR